MISAVVLTKNEEKNIYRCLRSLFWCEEIIIVDDYSSDKTLNIIQKLKFKMQNYKTKIKIYQRNLDDNFAAQRNYGLSKAEGDWVLFIDSDEVVTDNLLEEINNKVKNKNYDGYYIKRKDYFLGKWLKYGETGNIRLLRLVRKGKGFWRGRVHEKWDIKGATETLNSPLKHYPHDTISSFLGKINSYTDIVAQSWREQGRRMRFWEILVYPLGKFIDNYFIKFGLLDGVQGLIIAVMMSFHSFLVRGKYYFLKNKK